MWFPNIWIGRPCRQGEAQSPTANQAPGWQSIQHLLAESGHSGFDRAPVSVEATGAEVAADSDDLRSPETYVGYEQTQNFASPHGPAWNKPHSYEIASRLGLNSWALTGHWTAGKEAVRLNKPNGRIAYRFHARDLNLVMGPAMQGASVRFRVLLDGQPPTTARQFEIMFFDSGVEAFDFTFG